MKAEGHRQAAEQIEKGIAKLQPEQDLDMARLAVFIDNVKQDGIILYQRGTLPVAFATATNKYL